MPDQEETLVSRTTKALIECNLVHRRVFDMAMNDVTRLYRTQHHTLQFVRENPGVSQTKIAKEMRTSPAAVAVTLKKLEADGYIVRLADQKDGRYNQVSVTPKGQRVLDMADERFHLVEAAAFTGFSEEEQRAFLSLLNRVTQNMKDLEERVRSERSGEEKTDGSAG